MGNYSQDITQPEGLSAKKLVMSPLMKIAYNCQRATLLIEKKNLSRISIKERFELKLHLAGCSVCKLFQQQSLLIDKMVKMQFLTGDENLPDLDENFKHKLSKRIESEINARR